MAIDVHARGTALLHVSMYAYGRRTRMHAPATCMACTRYMDVCSVSMYAFEELFVGYERTYLFADLCVHVSMSPHNVWLYLHPVSMYIRIYVTMYEDVR